MARFNNLNALKTYIQKLGYKDIKDKDARSIFILTNENRTSVFSDLINRLGGKKNASRAFGGSLGHIDVDTYRIGVKPLSKQGAKSAGVDNETNLVGAINYVINEYGSCDILFTDGRHSFLCKQAKEAKQVGTDTAGRKKSDINIVSTTGQTVPVSLKKDNAEYWESADTLWRDNAIKYLNYVVSQQKIKVESIGGGAVKITPSIGIEATPQESTGVIFGSDILNKGCVITRTFDGSEFNYDGRANLLTIKCSSVITKLSEVPEDKKVWFLIRNDSTRKSIPDYPGVRCLATYKSRINQNVLKISAADRRTIK